MIVSFTNENRELKKKDGRFKLLYTIKKSVDTLVLFGNTSKPVSQSVTEVSFTAISTYTGGRSGYL